MDGKEKRTMKNEMKWKGEMMMKENREWEGKSMPNKHQEYDLKNWKDLLNEEEGMGTVEIILIIVEIFTGIQSVDNVNKGGVRGKSITQYTVDK